MIEPSQSLPFLDQLDALNTAHPVSPKVVFVPRMQLGQAIEVAAARRGGSWAGLTCHLPVHYAEKIARWDITTSGRSPLPAEGKRLLIASFLEQKAGRPWMKDLPDPQRLVGAASRAVDTLRRHGVAPEQVRSRAESRYASRAFRGLAACYEHVASYLEKHNLYDDADILEWAIQRVGDSPPAALTRTVFAVCDETDIPELTFRWLQALREKGAAFYRLGEDTAGQNSPRSAAAIFEDVPLPSATSTAASSAAPSAAADRQDSAAPHAAPDAAPHETLPETTRRDAVITRRAVGAENEVRGALRELISSGTPLDEVEIAYAASDPYLLLIDDCARQAGVEVTLGTGLPALQSRTGQLLRGFYEWIQDNFEVRILVRLLRSGLIRVDKHQAAANSEQPAARISPHEIATVLAGRSYEPGRRGIEKAFRLALEKYADSPSRRIPLEQTWEAVQDLLSLVPDACDVQDLAEESLTLLLRYGPIDPPDGEGPRTFEQSARNAIVNKLKGLAELPVSYRAEAAKLAGFLQRILEEHYVPPSRPEEGAAHVLPLESAGYTGRQHLIVIGMDNESLSQPAYEDVMLRDADREALSEGMTAALPQNRAGGEEAARAAQRALRRHRGSLSLYCSVFDIAQGEERYPASPFLEAESDAAAAHPILGFVPARDALKLDGRDSWLHTYGDLAAGARSSDRTAAELIATNYPWIRSGKEALGRITSDVYSAHDGLLKAGQYTDLDFLNPDYDGSNMSAGSLQTLAETPYLYFLKYVLRIRPLDEPALEDASWLDPLRRGILLHNTFERFMKRIDGRPARPDDEPALMDALDEELAQEKAQVAPSSRRVEDAARRALEADCRVFLHAEVEAAEAAEPLYHELGFGDGRYSREGDLGAVSLSITDEVKIPLQGRIDRVDRMDDGSVAIWDYKTGTAKKFSAAEPLQQGARLQWALYAYALSEATGEQVRSSGYFFATKEERGLRLSDDPAAYRETVNSMILRMSEMAATGSFPMNPKAHNSDDWRYKGYAPVFTDLKERSDQLAAKAYPEDRPLPLYMEEK